jgi:hypothetical protein
MSDSFKKTIKIIATVSFLVAVILFFTFPLASETYWVPCQPIGCDAGPFTKTITPYKVFFNK